MKFTQKKLKTGIKVMLAPMKDSLSTTVFVMVHTGSKYETKGNNGISHFIEHMCFKGTTKRPTAMDISKALDEIGSQYNAFTSQEFTGYYAKAHPKNIDILIDVISDIYLNSTFDAKELQKEKGVIIEEINMYEDMPHKQVQDVFSLAMYGDQPAGWSILGTKENIKKMSAKDLEKYWKSHYVASATTVLVTGNFDTRTITQKLQKAFEGISRSAKMKKRPVVEPQNRPKILVKHKKTDQAHFALGVRSYAGKHKLAPALKVLDAILGGGMSSRLFQKLREEMGVGYYLRTMIDEYTDHGYFSVSLGVDKDRAVEVTKAIIHECELLKSEKVGASELNKAKEYLIGNTILSLESSDAMAEYFAIQDITGEEITTPEGLIKKIRKVTAEDVQKAAREIFVNDRLVLSAVGPMKESLALKKALRFG
ncbi:MAG: pitrilysin family protein [Candidatus Zambryskibacteria bacterium]|nr:pitrilysin family protein [Candidatus Zambryskibacteria bacterium]